MGKRTNTAVWLEKYNRWQIKVQKDGQRKTFTSSTPGRTGQREANAKADQWLDGGIIGNKRVAELWAIYLERKKETVSTSYYNNIVSIGKYYILPAMGNRKIEKVQEDTLQQILDRAYRSGPFIKYETKKTPKLPLSRKYLQDIREQLVAFIKFCRIKLKVTTLNPEELTIPEGARPKGKNILQPEGLQKLFTVDTTLYRGKRVFDRFIYAYRFQVATGIRPGELKGIQLCNIHDDEVRIQRSINVYEEETKGKNDNAIRSFIMNDWAKAAYNGQIQLLQKMGISLDLNTPIFQISKHSEYYDQWKRYLKSNGIGHISLYELRHTFVSVVKNLPEGKVKALVGHSKNMDTFGQYGHEIQGEAEQTAQAVGNLFNQILQIKK